MVKRIAVVGAGAAGLFAAGTAAENGAEVWLYDKNEKPGRKLAITGKGRCNVTNLCTAQEFMDNVAVNGKFLYSAFNFFPPKSVMDFFERRGVRLKTERGRRVFPESDSAYEIVDALASYTRENRVKYRWENVAQILREDGLFRIGGGVFDSVIVCTGGASYPLTGSDGGGYKIAKSLGHTVTALSPSLVPLEIKEQFCAELSGLSLKNVALRLFRGEKCVFSDAGEMLFTHFGISGPLVLSASSHIRGENYGEYSVSIDLKPGLDSEKLDRRLLSDFELFKNKSYKNSLGNLLPKALIPIVAALSGIEPDKKVNAITRAERGALAELLKDFRLHVKSPRPIQEAIITSGGVKVSEIKPNTMESKVVPGLYFAGEIIDADAYTGGYNLQIAFSTGRLAGTSASAPS